MMGYEITGELGSELGEERTHLGGHFEFGKRFNWRKFAGGGGNGKVMKAALINTGLAHLWSWSPIQLQQAKVAVLEAWQGKCGTSPKCARHASHWLAKYIRRHHINLTA